MAADLYIHVLEDVSEEGVAKFHRNCIGSKFSGTPCTDEEWHDLYSRLGETPRVWVGEVSWLKAALFEDPDTFIPDPVLKVSEVVGEDFPVITDDLIERVEDALEVDNRTSYSVSKPEPVVKFLQGHKGKRCFTISW